MNFLKHGKSVRKLQRNPSNSREVSREQEVDDIISAHLAKEESKTGGDNDDTKGIIWIESRNGNNSHISRIVTNNNIGINQNDPNPNLTQYTWTNFENNRKYQIYFIQNASLVIIIAR